MSWRMRNWADGVTSHVSIKLGARGAGTTLLELHHTGIPTHDRHGNGGQERSAEGGWKERILGGIKAMIGFGMEEDD